MTGYSTPPAVLMCAFIALTVGVRSGRVADVGDSRAVRPRLRDGTRQLTSSAAAHSIAPRTGTTHKQRGSKRREPIPPPDPDSTNLTRKRPGHAHQPLGTCPASGDRRGALPVVDRRRVRHRPGGVHDIWCRPGRAEPWRIQVIIDESSDGDWVSRRDPSIRRPISPPSFPLSPRHNGNG